MNEINLNEILHKKLNQHKFDGHSINNLQWCIDAMIEACNQAIDLCAEEATVFMPSHPHLHNTKNVNKYSILNVKTMIK